MDDLSSDYYILRMSASVRGILVDFGAVAPRAEKVQGYMELARSPVGDAAEIPLISMAACDRHKLAWFTIENVHRVPLRRNIMNEFKRRLVRVGLGTIRHHLKWSLKDDVQRELLRSCPHHHGTLVASDEVVLCYIVKTARRVIQWACQHTCELKDGAVDRTVSSGNFVVFRSQDGFIAEHVWIGALDAPWFAGTMKIDHQVMLCGFTRNVVVEFYAVLIVAIDEVDLHSGNAPSFKERKGLFHLVHHRSRIEPDPHLYMLGSGITHQLRHIDVAAQLRDVTSVGPTGVEQHIGKARLRGEVYVIFHVLRGVSRLAIRPYISRPHIPGPLSRTEPAFILYSVWRIQVRDDIGLQQLAGLVCHQQNTPGRVVRQSSGEHQIWVVESRGELRDKPVAGPVSRRIGDVHARIAFKVGLRQRHPGGPG